VVAAAEKDEDTGGWESVFTEENQVPLYINLYVADGLYYELMESSEYQGTFYTSVFSEKRRLTGRLGMKIHIDAAIFHEQDEVPPVDNTLTFRRLRFNTFGRGFFLSPFTYGLEFGSSDGDFYFNDGYIWFHKVPYIGSVRCGIFKAPMSMEAQQSSSATVMMEVAAPVSTFTPGDLFGLQVGGAVKNMPVTLHAGWFADVVDNEYRDESQSYSRLIGRATWRPRDSVDEKGDGEIIHIGGSASHMFSAGGGVRFGTRPESYLAPVLIDTGTLEGEQGFVYGVEAAWQNNSTLIQSEFLQAHADDAQGTVHRFNGTYLTGAWVMTGERRNYNRDGGFFSRVEPDRPFSFSNGTWGALECVGRISYTDLTDDSIKGGIMSIASAGVNFYLTKRNRIMINGGYADVRKSANDGGLYFFQTRFQIDL